MSSAGSCCAFLPLLVLPCGPVSPNLVLWLLAGPSRTPGLLSCSQGLAQIGHWV